MKELTLVLEDDALCAVIESAAKRNGVAFEDVVIDAIRYWKSETELSLEEEAEIKTVMRDYDENGGIPHDELAHILEEDDAKLREALRNLEEESGVEAQAFLTMLRRKIGLAPSASEPPRKPVSVSI